jgi:cell division septation protein DedD
MLSKEAVMGVKNEVWLTVVIVAVAGVLLALSLTRDKAASRPATVTPAANGIKPAHDVPAVEKAPAAHPASAIVAMPNAVKAKDAFAIQVFSFKDKARADAALKQLKDKGYPAYVMMSDLGPRGIFYRVRVGSFTSEEEAKKNLESVNRDFKSGIIVAE